MENRKKLTADDINDILGENKRTLEEYIKPYIHKKVDLINENIYVVFPGDDVYKELIDQKARGVCHTKDGYIYFRNEVNLTAHLLIHEFVHRLSRNRKFVIKMLSWHFVEGIDFPKDCLNYLNEVITEMITSDITGLEEPDNPYTLGLDLMRQFANKAGKHSMVNAYFEGDIHFFKKRLGKYYKPFVYCFFNLISFYIKALSLNGDKQTMQRALEAGQILKSIIDII